MGGKDKRRNYFLGENFYELPVQRRLFLPH